MNKLVKVLCYLMLAVFLFVGGMSLGRALTIRQAELLDTTESEYYIRFGAETHEYTFNEE